MLIPGEECRVSSEMSSVSTAGVLGGDGDD
jgi:hypothetical protein